MPNNIPINVMFVEDDDATLKMLLKNIASWEIVNPVVSFKTCEEAWKYLEEIARQDDLPDVMFLDRLFQYSGMQGDELLKRIRDNRRYDGINIAMMTAGHPDVTVLDKYYELHVKGFFDKPITKDDFDDFMKKQLFKIQYIKQLERSA